MKTLKIKIKNITETEKEINLPYFVFDTFYRYAKVLGPTNIITISLSKAFTAIGDYQGLEEIMNWENKKEISEKEFEDVLEEAINRLTKKQGS